MWATILHRTWYSHTCKISEQTSILVNKKLTSWVGFILKVHIIHFLHHHLKKLNVHNCPVCCLWLIWLTTRCRVRTKWEAEESYSRAGSCVFWGIYTLQKKMMFLYLQCVSIDHSWNSTPNELISCLFSSRSLPLTDLSPAGVDFSLRCGEIINLVCSLTPRPFFFFAEVLKQIVPVSTGLWEICHVSSFKQVV